MAEEYDMKTGQLVSKWHSRLALGRCGLGHNCGLRGSGSAPTGLGCGEGPPGQEQIIPDVLGDTCL